MYCVYIIKSESGNHYYIGHSENVKNRLMQHNSGLVKSTKRYIPWEIIYTEEYGTKSEANIYRYSFTANL
jgi:putative endonuclease